VRVLFFILSVILALPSGAIAQTRNVPLVTGISKYLPAGHNRTKKDSISKIGLFLIADGKSLVKRRPAGYGFRRLSSKRLTGRISAKSAMVMDAVSGDIIYAVNPDMQRQPASTIKVLTGIISFDSLSSNDLVPVSRRAARMPRSKVYLRPGRKYKAGDLINALLLASANDASVALAEKIGGSEKVFAKLMTARAASIGATHTMCKSASGLTRRGQHTTARDLAKIFNYAMQNPMFAKTMERTKVRTSYGKIIRSHNRALWQVKGAEGGKTGYTAMARQTYVGSFKRGNDELVVAIMGSETMWDDVKNLVRFGFAKKRRMRQTLALKKKSAGAFKLAQLAGSQNTLKPLAYDRGRTATALQ
jgi:D-alanyl-D-alanine carboxypeptidase (penicillin-binding protein 5/6)